jgi:hypothetical protein
VAANQHSAPSQALGYVYQVGWGLLELAKPGPEDFELRLESLDDVSWHDARGNPLEALQIKHHMDTPGTLSDMSVDLWRTVQVWLDNPVLREPDGPALFLVTTQAVPGAGALARLGPDGRSVDEALELLDAAARDSTNQATATTRASWLRQTVAVRAGLVTRLTVVSRQASAQELAQEVRRALTLTLPVGREEPFVEALLGWWWRVGVDMLSGTRGGVTRVNLRLHLDDLHEQFSSHSLPITVGLEGLPDSVDSHRSRIFARQLEWVEAGDALLLLAIRDYYRAYSQMQAWVEKNMIGFAELQGYEQRIVEEWTMQFELMRQALGTDASEKAMRDAGMRLYAVAMNQSPTHLRAGLTDPFYARGTHHRLADVGTVGWHPDFAQRLEDLIGGRVA